MKVIQGRGGIKKSNGAELGRVRAYLDGYLRVAEVKDYGFAWNGLQVDNFSQRVRKIGAAVDGCEVSVRMAAEEGVTLLLVHHGLFWQPNPMVEGALYRKLKMAMEADMAIYSSHLPLDLHPVVGNSALLWAAMGLKKKGTEPFFWDREQFLGLKGTVSMTREELAGRLAKAVGGPVKVIAGGPERVSRVGLVTGGAGGELPKAVREGVDTFVTGEGPHWTYTVAEEMGVNVLYGGHYATETFGVKALAGRLSKRFGVPWVFIDHPTGL